MMQYDRIVPLEGVTNFRDLGGYTGVQGKTVKWGKLYRSGDLHTLTENDLAFLAKRGLRSIVDFRVIDEMLLEPDKACDTVENIYELPVDSGCLFSFDDVNEDNAPWFMENMNRALVNESQKQYATFFAYIMAAENLPLLFHCAAGKDRTGLAAALFLAGVGVERETIYADYLMSAKFAEEKYAKLIAANPHLLPVMTVRRSYLEAAFEEIDNKYGGAEAYLTNQLGVDLARLRALFLE